MITEEEFVVHLFAPLGGPDADAAADQLGLIWAACRAQLGTTFQIPGEPFALDLPSDLRSLPAESVVAAAQSSPSDAERQVIVRRLRDVVNLSVAMAQPRRLPTRPLRQRLSGTPEPKRSGWAQFARLWDRVNDTEVGALLGEHRLFIATVARRSAPSEANLPALAAWAQSSLPPRPDRSRGWADRGAIASNFGVWEVASLGDAGPLRELVIVGASDRDAELSALTWSDGSSRMPPLANYLLTTSRVRHQARLLRAWQGTARFRADDLGLDLGPERSAPAESLSPRPVRMKELRDRSEYLFELENELTRIGAELAAMERTGVIGLDNTKTWLAEIGWPEKKDGSVFARDLAVASLVPTLIRDEIEYHRIDLGQVAAAVASARARLQELERAPVQRSPALAPGERPSSDNAGPEKVFVVYAHESEEHRQSVLDFVDFLRSRCGIDAELDRYFVGQRQDWPRWSRNLIRTSRFVIVIASPQCRDALEQGSPVYRNQGVRDELALLQELLLEDEQVWDRKILPVILPPYGIDQIPQFLRPRAKDWYSVPTLTPEAASDLLDTLRGGFPIARPPLARS